MSPKQKGINIIWSVTAGRLETYKWPGWEEVTTDAPDYKEKSATIRTTKSPSRSMEDKCIAPENVQWAGFCQANARHDHDEAGTGDPFQILSSLAGSRGWTFFEN